MKKFFCLFILSTLLDLLLTSCSVTDTIYNQLYQEIPGEKRENDTKETSPARSEPQYNSYYKQTVDLTDSEISKIELIANDVTINIYGRSEKSYVELINFRENSSSISHTNRILSIDEIPDIASVKIAEDRTKVINVYLTTDKELKIFDIKSTTCTVNIENMTTGTDYNISADNLTLNSKVVKTSSTININAGKDDSPATSASLNLQTTFVTNLNINASELFLNADLFRCNGEAKIVCDTGDVAIRAVKDPSALNLDLKTVSGKLFVGEEEVHTPYSLAGSEESAGSLSIESISADISVSCSTLNDVTDAPEDYDE